MKASDYQQLLQDHSGSRLQLRNSEGDGLFAYLLFVMENVKTNRCV